MLNVSAYRLTFIGPATARLPDWLGSTWRGAMGHALKRNACHCNSSTHIAECVYSQLFKTPVPADATRLRKYPAAPHPYILRPHLRSTEHPEQLVVDALLLGNARAHSRTLLAALTEGAAAGLSPARVRYSLAKIEDISQQLTPQIAPHTTQINITFVSPHLIKHRGQMMNCDRFELTGWLTNLMRRCNSLRYFHGDGVEPEDTDVRSMLDAFQQATVQQQQLQWQRAARHSSRQKQQIDQSGLVGQLHVDLGANAARILPLLISGTSTHVGKSAVMGHGQYKLEAAT